LDWVVGVVTGVFTFFTPHNSHASEDALFEKKQMGQAHMLFPPSSMFIPG
jgi:hypothetical protein